MRSRNQTSRLFTYSDTRATRVYLKWQLMYLRSPKINETYADLENTTYPMICTRMPTQDGNRKAWRHL